MTSPIGRSTDDLLEHFEWVRSLAAHLVFDAGQRGDLEQEIWRAALQKPPSAAVPLRAWLAGVAHNLAAMMARSQGRRRRREWAASRPLEVASTEQLVAQAELQQRLLAAVQALPEAMREVVLLRFFEQMPPRAIASRLDVPVATVRSRLQRAQARLREQLDTEFGDRRTWVLACAGLARPHHIAAAAGAGATLFHATLFVMKTQKLLVAAAAALLVAVPTAFLWSSARPAAATELVATAAVASPAQSPVAAVGPAAFTPERAAVHDGPTAAQLGGKVVDQAGAPIAGVTLRRCPEWNAERLVEAGKAQPGDLIATSAEDGRFVLPAVGVDKGTAWLLAEHDDYTPVQKDTTCRVGEATTIVMWRTHRVPLVVEVRDRSSHVPAPRFEVTATTRWRDGSEKEGQAPRRRLEGPEAGVGRNGVFRGTASCLEGLPLELRIDCPGHGRGEWNDGTDAPLLRELVPVPGQPLQVTFEVDLDAAEKLATTVQRGRIVDATNEQPVAGVRLAMYREGQGDSTRVTQSRADGTFVLAMPRQGGEGSITVLDPDYQLTGARARPDEELVLRVLPRATLTCHVVDRDGRPVAGAPVLCKAPDQSEQRLHTDPQGEVHVRGLLEGRCHVFLLAHAGDQDENAIVGRSCVVTAGKHAEVTLTAASQDSVQVFGTIVGGGPGLAPVFVPWTGTEAPVRGIPVGNGYEARDLARGDYLVLLGPANDDLRNVPTSLLPHVRIEGAGKVAVDLVVPTGIVRGRLVTTRADARQLRILVVPETPAEGPAGEWLRGKAVRHLGRAPAADGTFEVPRVAEGPCCVEVHEGAKVLAKRTVTVGGLVDLGNWSLDE